jgi:hypothetical protein
MPAGSLGNSGLKPRFCSVVRRRPRTSEFSMPLHMTHVYVCVTKEHCAVLAFGRTVTKIMHARRLVLTKWFNFGSNRASEGHGSRRARP